MPEVSFRLATSSDAPAVAALHATSWRDAYASILDPNFLAGPIEADRLELWNTRLLDAGQEQIVYVAEDDDREVLGFICAFRNADPTWGSLVDNLHVAPRMRGRGIGEKLIRLAAMRLANDGAQAGLHLWVFDTNLAGLRFYERLGGRVVGQDVSRMPAANGRTILRVHWPTLQTVADGRG